jgi:two-component system alkaline phosphatase synthesis response regulator PhoP
LGKAFKGQSYSQGLRLQDISERVKPLILTSRRFDVGESDSTGEKGMIINREKYVVEKDGRTIHLPRKEFELLALLASKPNHVFERDIILDKVWGSDIVVGDRTIDVHIRKLREKLGNDYIKTVKGIGYRFVYDPNN